MRQKAKSSKNGYSSYPTTLMLVSNTETAMSWSKVACWMTSWTPFSNSSMSPRTTNVSKESISVSVKLQGKNQCIDFSCSKYGMKRLKEIPTNDGETIIENLWNVRTVEKRGLLSKSVVNISSIGFEATKPTSTAQWHQFVCRKCIFHIGMVSMIKHVTCLFPEKMGEKDSLRNWILR